LETKEKIVNAKATDGESYNNVLHRVLKTYSQDSQESLDETRVRELAREEINDMVAYKALEQ
jgi:hypothetical protein